MDYYASPIPSLMDGLLKGVALGHSINQARQQEQEFKTRQALENQQLSMNDILNTRAVQSMGRPVGPGGTISQPGLSVTLPNPSTPAIPGNLGADNQAATPPIPAMQLPDSLQGTIQQPGYVRKADPSRTVSYTNRAGQKTTTELYTPEEQAQHALQDTLNKRYGTATMVNTPASLTSLGLPAQMWIPNEHLAQYAQEMGYLQPVPTPKSYQDMGGPPTMPLKELPSVMSTVGAAQRGAEANTRAANQLKSQQQIAEENRTSREKIAAQGQAAQTERTAASNKARLDAAAIRNARGLTPGQEEVKAREERRRQDAVQKDLGVLQGQENKIHADRLQLGKLMGGLDPAKLPAAQAKMAGYNQQIQDIQARKAQRIGAVAPNQQQISQIQEGETRPAPDGHLWKKQDGIVYMVK